MHINCYPVIFRQRAVDCYNLKKMPIKELLVLFKISRGSLYNWVQLYKSDNLHEKKKYCKISKAAKNIPGIDVISVKRLNTELLAPGTIPGRATLFTKDAVEAINKEKLFL